MTNREVSDKDRRMAEALCAKSSVPEFVLYAGWVAKQKNGSLADRLLIVGEHHVFTCTAGRKLSVGRCGHLFELTRVHLSGNKIEVDFVGFQSQFHAYEAEEIVRALFDAYSRVTVGWPSAKMAEFTGNARVEGVDNIYERPDLAYGGLFEAYRAACAFSDMPIDTQLIDFLMDEFELDPEGGEVTLNELPNIKQVQLKPLVTALRHNEWARSFALSDFTKRDAVTACAALMKYNTKIKTITMSAVRAAKGYDLLGLALKNNPGPVLSALTLSKNAIKDKYCKALGEGLACCPLTFLDLSECEMSAKGLAAIFVAFEQSPSVKLRSVNLSGNSFKRDGTEALVSLLVSPQALKVRALILSGTQLAVTSLAPAVEHLSKLAVLDISHNQIADSASMVLANAIRRSPVTDVDLSACRISNSALSNLMRATVEPANRTRAMLNISRINIGVDVREIAESVSHAQALHTLEMEACELGDGLFEFMDAIKHLRTLRRLSVGANCKTTRITDSVHQAMVTLAAFVSTSHQLEALSVRGNAKHSLGPAIIPVLSSLAQTTTLTELDVSGNGYGDEGARAISDALAHNASLTYLALDENDITAAGFTALADGIFENNSLFTLELPLIDLQAIGKRLKKAETKSLKSLVQGVSRRLKINRAAAEAHHYYEEIDELPDGYVAAADGDGAGVGRESDANGGSDGGSITQVESVAEIDLSKAKMLARHRGTKTGNMLLADRSGDASRSRGGSVVYTSVDNVPPPPDHPPPPMGEHDSTSEPDAVTRVRDQGRARTGSDDVGLTSDPPVPASGIHFPSRNPALARLTGGGGGRARAGTSVTSASSSGGGNLALPVSGGGAGRLRSNTPDAEVAARGSALLDRIMGEASGPGGHRNSRSMSLIPPPPSLPAITEWGAESIGLDKRTMLTANRMAIADFDLDDDDDEGNDGNRKDGDNGSANGAYHLDYRGSVYSKVPTSGSAINIMRRNSIGSFRSSSLGQASDSVIDDTTLNMILGGGGGGDSGDDFDDGINFLTEEFSTQKASDIAEQMLRELAVGYDSASSDSDVQQYTSFGSGFGSFGPDDDDGGGGDGDGGDNRGPADDIHIHLGEGDDLDRHGGASSLPVSLRGSASNGVLVAPLTSANVSGHTRSLSGSVNGDLSAPNITVEDASLAEAMLAEVAGGDEVDLDEINTFNKRASIKATGAGIEDTQARLSAARIAQGLVSTSSMGTIQSRPSDADQTASAGADGGHDDNVKMEFDNELEAEMAAVNAFLAGGSLDAAVAPAANDRTEVVTPPVAEIPTTPRSPDDDDGDDDGDDGNNNAPAIKSAGSNPPPRVVTAIPAVDLDGIDGGAAAAEDHPPAFSLTPRIGDPALQQRREQRRKARFDAVVAGKAEIPKGGVAEKERRGSTGRKRAQSFTKRDMTPGSVSLGKALALLKMADKTEAAHAAAIAAATGSGGLGPVTPMAGNVINGALRHFPGMAGTSGSGHDGAGGGGSGGASSRNGAGASNGSSPSSSRRSSRRNSSANLMRRAMGKPRLDVATGSGGDGGGGSGGSGGSGGGTGVTSPRNPILDELAGHRIRRSSFSEHVLRGKIDYDDLDELENALDKHMADIMG